MCIRDSRAAVCAAGGFPRGPPAGWGPDLGLCGSCARLGDCWRGAVPLAARTRSGDCTAFGGRRAPGV
eukprot:10235739-Alexandrium_andersonii.AAC.1